MLTNDVTTKIPNISDETLTKYYKLKLISNQSSFLKNCNNICKKKYLPVLHYTMCVGVPRQYSKYL